MRKLLWVALFTGVGCLGSAKEAPEHPLGIARYDVDETATAVSITGLGADGAQIGKVTVTKGRFTMQEDQREVDGLQVAVDVLGKTAAHESEGSRVRQLPAFHLPEHEVINDFLGDPAVKTVLARWQITIEEPDPMELPDLLAEPDRAEPATHACGYPQAPACGAIDCEATSFYFNGSQCDIGEYQVVCCGGTHKVAGRRCGMGGENTCGDEGPNGCAQCWVADWSNSCSVSPGSLRKLTCSGTSMWMPYGPFATYN